MVENDEYVRRLEKILEEQDKLLSQSDARFKQQKALSDEVARRNSYLNQDLTKYKNLLKDMKKSLTQHEKTIAKLKEELEEQLKIQQKLHKDYGEIIQELTDEAEKNEKFENKTPKEHKTSKSNKPTLPPREDKVEPFYKSTNIGEKSQKTTNKSGTANKKPKTKTCPKCGKNVDATYSFCDDCGQKLI